MTGTSNCKFVSDNIFICNHNRPQLETCTGPLNHARTGPEGPHASLYLLMHLYSLSAPMPHKLYLCAATRKTLIVTNQQNTNYIY